jgi:hypothetical protein
MLIFLLLVKDMSQHRQLSWLIGEKNNEISDHLSTEMSPDGVYHRMACCFAVIVTDLTKEEDQI